MPLEFNCPECGREYKVAESNAGKNFACKGCGNAVTVPDAALADGSERQVPQAVAPGKRPTLPRPRLPGGGGGQRPRMPGGSGPGPARPHPQGYQQPYGHAAPQGQMMIEPHRGVMLLVFAILSWAICAIFGIVALVMAGNDLKKIKRGAMDRSGEGLTKAAYWISVAHLILTALALVLILVLIAFASSMQSSQTSTYQSQPRYSTVLPD